VLTQPDPVRTLASTRAIVASSPAITAIRKSGPYGLDIDRTNAQACVAPARVASSTPVDRRTPGRPSTRLLTQLAEVWRDLQYCCQRLDHIQRPWLHDGPIRWTHSRRDGWYLLGSTLP